MKSIRYLLALLLIALVACHPDGNEYHVSPYGDDSNSGSEAKPLRTIAAAARIAQPGDRITVHEGVYRERINPPRGGFDNDRRIIYQAAAGEKVVIKGSEQIKGWEPVREDTWKVIIPNEFFGDFNPYRDTIYGDWFNRLGRKHHTGAVYLDGHWLTEALNLEQVIKPCAGTALWYAESDTVENGNTVIWAQFDGMDPNQSNVEINVRQSVFYPDSAGRSFITVRGFVMEHAATPWAPPTAEQTGLIGTHWSKGWIIENNTIRYSTCVGLTLGKHGDEWDNTSQNTAEGYVKTIERAMKNGWSGENIGHHIVRNNEISYCEQAGIVGSLGAVFSKVIGNEIHDIHRRRLFTGAEMAGIKFHAPIDAVIKGNHIFRCCRGIWLDWMTQGTRVTANLLHDNYPFEDLFFEVNHGPFLVDNNILLSQKSLLVNSQGGAYVHNLIAGELYVITGERRQTPFHKPHSTELAGMHDNLGGDERYYNNMITGESDFSMYDHTGLPVYMGGNIYLNGAKPGKWEENPPVFEDFNPQLHLTEESDGYYFEMQFDLSWAEIRKRDLITTEILGKAATPDLPYEQIDGQPYVIDKDYFGNKRDTVHPFPGPFRVPENGTLKIKVWPVVE